MGGSLGIQSAGPNAGTTVRLVFSPMGDQKEELAVQQSAS